MKKRKSPVAKSLVNNSISAMISTIEIHNKPEIKYRYETVVLLLLNSWELLLKGYLYKYHKKIKIFEKDGRTKPFENCLNIVSVKIGSEFNPTKENLEVLYDYRNQTAHFYIDEINPILYSIISKSIIFYNQFILKHFKIDLAEKSDLILLPIGFKRPISPIDYISNESVNKNSSKEVKHFLNTIINSTKRLNEQNIDDTIFVEFRMNLTNVNRTKNADLIAGIDNSIAANLKLDPNKKPIKIISSNEGEKVIVSRNKEESNGIIYYEELQDGIFDEINNIVEANRILAKDSTDFLMGTSIYYRIYAERDYVNFNIKDFELLCRYGALQSYSPFLFWLTKLPSENIAKIMFDILNSKHPNVMAYIKLCFFLGTEIEDETLIYLDKKLINIIQKPTYYYTFLELKKSRQKNKILRILKCSKDKKIYQNKNLEELTQDSNYLENEISHLCNKVFKEKATENRSIVRDLDYVYYHDKINNIEDISTNLKSLLLTSHSQYSG